MGIAFFWDRIGKIKNDQLRIDRKTDTLLQAALDIVYCIDMKNTYELLILQHHFISDRLNQSLILFNIREQKASNNGDLTGLMTSLNQ